MVLSVNFHNKEDNRASCKNIPFNLHRCADFPELCMREKFDIISCNSRFKIALIIWDNSPSTAVNTSHALFCLRIIYLHLDGLLHSKCSICHNVSKHIVAPRDLNNIAITPQMTFPSATCLTKSLHVYANSTALLIQISKHFPGDRVCNKPRLVEVMACRRVCHYLNHTDHCIWRHVVSLATMCIIMCVN